MRPTSSKENEKEGTRKSLNDTSNTTEASLLSSSTTNTCQPFEIILPRLHPISRLSVKRTTFPSEIAHKISKKKKEKRLNSAFFYFSLILIQQLFSQPIKNHLIISTDNLKNIELDNNEYSYLPSKNLNTKDMYSFEGNTEQLHQYNNDGSHELFDPAIGKFEFEQNHFFAPRFRWRNDAELASYAWNRQGKSQVNMMMTENRVSSYGPTTSDKASCGSSCTPRDPSLMDYDAIDVSWRNDIEREKSRPAEYSSQQRDAYDTQFERDLQVLHEKGYISPFTTEEADRYEELSKAQFADFYRTVAIPSKPSSSYGQSSSRATNYATTAPSSSVFSYRSNMNNREGSQHSDCQRSEDGYSNDSGFGSNTDDERNGDEHNNNVDAYYSIRDEINSEPHFDNVTLAYEPYNNEENLIIPQQSSVSLLPLPVISSVPTTVSLPSDETSPVLGHYTENGPETLETSFELNEDEYFKYVTNQQVLEDISQSATEQSFEAADQVLERVQREHEIANITVDFTPFDEPLPFFDDDFFLNFDENVVADAVVELSSSPSESHEYRMYGKLIPEPKFENDENEHDDFEDGYEGEDFNLSDNKGQRRRGRQSKDNDLVKKHDLPATAEELAAMSHKSLQALLKDPTLNETQKSLIKRIRRRGRNKEAARKCRERRILPTTPGSSSTIFETSTSTPQVIHHPFIVYPPTRCTKVA